VQRGGRGLVERTPGEGTPPRGCAGRGRGGPSSAVSGRRRWGKLRHVGGGGGNEGEGAPLPGEKRDGRGSLCIDGKRKKR
jgi:hypothetical protein